MLERKLRDALEWDKQSKLPFHMGHFPYSPKTFENLENGAEISRKRFQKFWKVLNFRNENHSTENSGNSGSKVEWKENFRGNIFENLGITREVFLFFGNFGKCSVPFASAKNSNQTFWLNGKRPTMYMYPWLFCTLTNCKGPINSYQCNLTLWIVELWCADYTLAIIKTVLYK